MRKGANITTKERADRAFNLYYAMGNQRSLELLKQTLHKESTKISIDTLKVWSNKYQWQSRIAELNRKVQDKVEKRMLRDVTTIKIRQQDIIDTWLASLLTKFKEQKEAGLLPEFNYQDGERLLKLEQALHGIAKEGPTVVNPMQFMQVTLNTSDQLLEETLRALPPDDRIKMCRAMDEAKKRISPTAIKVIDADPVKETLTQ